MIVQVLTAAKTVKNFQLNKMPLSYSRCNPANGGFGKNYHAFRQGK